MGLHDEAKLDRKFMELAKLMNIYLNHFPKHLLRTAQRLNPDLIPARFTRS